MNLLKINADTLIYFLFIKIEIYFILNYQYEIFIFGFVIKIN